MGNRSRRGSLWSCAVAVLALGCFLTLAPRLHAQRDQTRLYVTVLDSGGKPAKGLTAKDFTVKEDGENKTILSAAPATEPMSVAILTDRFGQDNTYGVFDVRLTFSTFLQTLHKGSPDSEVSFMTFDGAAVQQVKPTSGTVELENVFKKLFSTGNSPVMLEAILDATALLDHAATDRRVIFVVYAGYKVETSGIQSPAVANAIYRSRASLWALEGVSTFQVNPPNVEREQITNRGVTLSGGLHDTVGVGSALESRAKRMAEFMLAQYAVVYGAPGVNAQAVEVAVPGLKGAKILAPKWPLR